MTPLFQTRVQGGDAAAGGRGLSRTMSAGHKLVRTAPSTAPAAVAVYGSQAVERRRICSNQADLDGQG